MPRFEVSRALPYEAEKLFDLAADVESYPEFLPWWLSATVLRREGDVYFTDQVVGLGPVRQRFGSKTVLRRPETIEVTSIDGTFETFRLAWRFASQSEWRCQVSLAGEIEIRAPLLSATLGRVVANGAGSILEAFEVRAHRLFAPSAR